MPNEFAVQTKLIGTTINSRISANRNWVYSDWVRTAHYRGFQFDHMALLFEISVSIFWRFVLLNGSRVDGGGCAPAGGHGGVVNRTAVGLTTCGGRQEARASGGRDADYGIGIIATNGVPPDLEMRSQGEEWCALSIDMLKQCSQTL